MLQEIRDILVSIGDFFKTIIDFVISLFQDLVYMVKLVGETVAELPEYFSWMPASLVAIIVSIFALVVIYKILGREG